MLNNNTNNNNILKDVAGTLVSVSLKTCKNSYIYGLFKNSW